MAASTSSLPWDRVWLGPHLATMHGIGIGEIRDGALAVSNGRIAWIGTRAELVARRDWSAHVVTEAEGLWITPGLIDCHTHLIYAGDRGHEFAARLRGATYEEIALAGGGIVSTMRATRQASVEELIEQSMGRARGLIGDGVTTLEVKSGYGLDLETELKMLRAGRLLAQRLGVSVVTTFLGAHALPPEFAGRQDDYVRHLIEVMLPAIAAEKLADAVDAYHERIAFSGAQTALIFERAQQLGLPVRLHADQLSDCGGGALAAQYGALSADHLEYTSQSSLERMAASNVVAGLLPGAFYYLREKQLPPIEQMRSLGIAMAVATDCNPGTSPIASLLLVMNMACVLFKLTPAETLLGVTRYAARALGLEQDRGTLRVGMRADLAAWRVRHPEQLCAEVGVHRPVEVLVGQN
jgi:imidazolonepropionase